MALERKILFERMELDKDDNVSILLKKAVVDGESLVNATLHRVLVPAGADVDAVLAGVNAHLAQDGFPAIPAAVSERPKRLRILAGQLPTVDKPNGKPQR